VPRISPLAAGLPGLALIAWTVLYLVGVQRAVRYIPLRTDAFGAGFEAMLFNGVLAAAGFVLVIPLFIPSRWRRALPDEDEPLTGTVSASGSTLLSPNWGETTPIIQQQQPPFGQ
jgi:hypothetical protein